MAIIAAKLGNALKPCAHEWKDYGTYHETAYGHVTGKQMVQRCDNCTKFRRLKIF